MSGRGVRPCPGLSACWPRLRLLPDPDVFLLFFSLVRPNRARAWVSRAERSLSFSALSSFTSSACRAISAFRREISVRKPVIEWRPLSISAAFRSRCRRATSFSSLRRFFVLRRRPSSFSSARAAASFSRLLSKTLRSPLSSLRARTDSRLHSSARASNASRSPSSSATLASAASARTRSRKYRRSQSSADETGGAAGPETETPEFNMRPD